VIALGRRLLAGGDLVMRSIALLVLGGAIGGVVGLERRVLGSGYPDLHVGATLGVIVIAGVAIRIAWRPRVPALVAAAVGGLAIGTAAAAAAGGLASTADRQLLATLGDQSRDVVRLWRGILDFDRDGSSAVLGGGDCDDFDARRIPARSTSPAMASIRTATASMLSHRASRHRRCRRPGARPWPRARCSSARAA